MECGTSKPVCQLTVSDKEEIVQLLCLRDVLFSCKSAIDQFMEGLDEVLQHTSGCLHEPCLGDCVNSPLYQIDCL